MVINISKSGAIIPDLTGHEVPQDKIPNYYAIVSRVMAESQNTRSINNDKHSEST